MTLRKLLQLSALMLLLMLGTWQAAQAAPMVHPGAWHTEADLERIRANVAAGREPWKSAWTALQNSDAGLNATPHVSADVTNDYQIQNDGHAAYVLAVKWVASGDSRYARASMHIIDAWSSTVHSVGNEPMRNGLGVNQMANAAEILRYGFHGSAGWPSADAERCRAWFKTVVYPHLQNGASANWGTSALAGIMSMSVFCNDPAMFQSAVTVYKHGFVVNGSLKDGCSGVTQYIDATGGKCRKRPRSGPQPGWSRTSGGNCPGRLEPGRQPGGLQRQHRVRDYGVSGANRLQIGMEYIAKYNLGHETPYHPFYEYCNNVTKYPDGISVKGRGKFSPIWEMAYSLFTEAGLKSPYCAQIIHSPGYAPETTNSDHPGLGTLTFRR